LKAGLKRLSNDQRDHQSAPNNKKNTPAMNHNHAGH